MLGLSPKARESLFVKYKPMGQTETGPIHGGILGQVGRGPEQPGLVGGNPPMAGG